MPELPDVERFAKLTREHALGHEIVDVDVRSSTIVHGNAAALRDGVRGRIVVQVARHGKWLFVSTTAPQLIVHFGMTGSLRWTTQAQPARADDRVIVRFGNGDLILSDRRNLATLALAGTDEERVAITGPLGPDARALTRADLDRVLDRRRSVKVTLMDQSIVAGLGNMLTDELLWRACLDPTRPAASLTGKERDELHRMLRRVLTSAVVAGHIPRGPTWLSGQRAEPNPTCPRCRRPMRWRRVGARSSLWCPHCQTEHHRN